VCAWQSMSLLHGVVCHFCNGECGCHFCMKRDVVVAPVVTLDEPSHWLVEPFPASIRDESFRLLSVALLEALASRLRVARP